MLRPCFLVIDREQAGSISTRKLVIETAKFNVITAYSGHEALEAMRKFPNVDGVVMDAGMKDVPCSELIRGLKDFRPNLKIVVVGDRTRYPCQGEDIFLESFDPKRLLSLLQEMEPNATSAILQQDAALEAQ